MLGENQRHFEDDRVGRFRACGISITIGFVNSSITPADDSSVTAELCARMSTSQQASPPALDGWGQTLSTRYRVVSRDSQGSNLEAGGAVCNLVRHETRIVGCGFNLFRETLVEVKRCDVINR